MTIYPRVESSSELSTLSTNGTENNYIVSSSESQPTEAVKGLIDNPEEVQKQSPANEDESSFTSQTENKEVETASEKNAGLSNSNGQTGIDASEQAQLKAFTSLPSFACLIYFYN